MSTCFFFPLSVPCFPISLCDLVFFEGGTALLKTGHLNLMQ